MGKIVWLASYPKSGNTWMRAFLANLFRNPDAPVGINDLHRFAFGDARADFYETVAGRPLEEISDAELHALRPKVHRLIAAKRPETLFVKTHNASLALEGVPLITPEVTAAAIYIIRNPLDVTLSYAHHFGLSLEETVEAMASPSNQVLTVGRNVFQHIADWSGHVESWTGAAGLACHVVRYEDLVRQPGKTFGKVVKFLRLPPNPARLAKAVRFSAFETLARQEQEAGFIERSKNTDRFFRKGRVGEWREALSPETVEKVVEAHGAVMRKFGYLGKDGRPRS